MHVGVLNARSPAAGRRFLYLKLELVKILSFPSHNGQFHRVRRAINEPGKIEVISS